MAKLEEVGEVVSTDLLVVGGGIAGLAAAIRAKEVSPDVNVLLVDKQTIGWGGKANRGGGILWVLGPDNDIDRFVEYHVKNIGDYLNDQELLRLFASETYGAVEKLAEWGVNVMKNAEGKIDLRPFGSFGWCLGALDLDLMRPLRTKASKLGVKFMDKTEVARIFNQGDRVTGAFGFNLIDGRSVVFKAKAIILANGDCGFKATRMWSSACGEGIAAAYWAGAEMRNAEFGNFYDTTNKATGISLVWSFPFLYNALGEHISPKYVSAPQPDIPASIVLGIEKEILEGRGPVYADMGEYGKSMAGRGLGGWNRPHQAAFRGIGEEKMRQYGPQPAPRVEVSLGFNAEFAPVKVDHDMKTTVQGLWAIGDTSWAGSGWPGAMHPPAGVRGSGLMNAVLGALRGGPSAARYASGAAPGDVDAGDAQRIKETVFAPLGREKGYSPAQAVEEIQEVIIPTKYNMRRSKDRLEEALSKVAKVQERLPELCAKDAHGVGQCNEARCMALCAEINFRAALARTESRGWHYREDYPKRDDKNWLKWVIVKEEKGKMVVSTEPLPMDRYKVKP
jgi:succinate dehydrogenase / fumarate reductase, flavoprotein subunit